MQGAGLRIEAMRFGLLIVLTVALLSVAFRIHSHDTASQARPPSRPATSPATTPGSGATPSAPSTTGSSSPSTSPTSGAQGHPTHHPPGSGQPGAAGGQQTLPVTGWDSAMKLGALAFLLIGGGAIAVRAGTPRRQPAETVHD